MTVGIISPMKEEIALLVELLDNVQEEKQRNITFYKGERNNHTCIVAWAADWGKVAISAVTQCMLDRYEIDHVILTGVAGAINEKLNVGDIIICTDTLQHDFQVAQGIIDMSVNTFEVSVRGKKIFQTDEKMRQLLHKAATEFVEKDHPSHQSFQELGKPVITYGRVLSGDQVISDDKLSAYLRKELDGDCVEMEGAAVAQVCEINDIPFSIFRIVSDKADHSMHIDFPGFVKNFGAFYTSNIVVKLLDMM